MSMNAAAKLPESEQSNFSKEDSFIVRHIGPNEEAVAQMVKALGCRDLEDFTAKVIPPNIALKNAFALSDFNEERSEREVLARLRAIAEKNGQYKSYIGTGYYDCFVPPVIQRNILENPGWYTQYTPYQPEISQGRLEALLNFQTMVAEMTGLPISNASLLDEGTAAAEAMTMSHGLREKQGGETANTFFVSKECHPQTIAVVQTRAKALGLNVVVDDHASLKFSPEIFGVLVQYPSTNGTIYDYKPFVESAHKVGAIVTVAADILALALLTPPGEFGADIAIGSTQRFGVPMGFGGPHAAYFATKDEYKRVMPGRLVGVSKDSQGRPAIRLALQTREQHIRREKATSNICTAQVLLSVMASMYAAYHGPKGIKRIASRVAELTGYVAASLKQSGLKVLTNSFFDTIQVEVSASDAAAVFKRAEAAKVNLRIVSPTVFGLSLNETTTEADVEELLCVLGASKRAADAGTGIPQNVIRKGEYLSQPVFNRYHSETDFQRYVRKLESRDLSLCASMIPLGSCTMKLNAAAEMYPVTYSGFGNVHPFAPSSQSAGYAQLCTELEHALAEITGFAAVSLQPNAGSQGEYAGLLAIRGYLNSTGQGHRNVCLIPKSAHGTNPASAVMAGLKVVVTECDEHGNVDVADLKAKAAEYSKDLAVLMVTYPSTHGVFEEAIKEICEIIHKNGGQVYMDGANLNAQVGLCRPADFGADVSHINLHKTFCIPHGGGGPGMGPIAVAKHLAPFLPGHPVVALKSLGSFLTASGPVSAAPWGSASILPISYAYIAMMGAAGLRRATQVAILNANYIANRLDSYYPVLYKGKNGFVAHECIIDLRPLKEGSGVEVEDVAKRLMDYGFHAPTVSFPVVGTMMVEPTESESKAELDRFCDAMIAIRAEIQAIADGKMDKRDNPLKNAPHTAESVSATEWTHPYSREVAAFPAPSTRDYKFWPSVGRIDGPYGDRNLICTCPDISSYK